MKNKGLGRGLDALLSNDDITEKNTDGLKMLGTDQLVSGKYQPRIEIDKEQ